MPGASQAQQSLVEAVRHAAPPGAISVWELNPAATHLALTHAHHLAAPAATCPVADSPLSQQALAAGSAMIEWAVTAPADPLLAPFAASHPQAAPHSDSTLLAVRLGTHEQPLGLLVIYTAARHTFSPTETATLHALCQLGGVALAATRQAAELARAEAGRNQFIHVTTHELRSPLAVSQTLVRNVVKGYAGALTDKQRDVFTRISNQLDRLEGLVNDLLDLAASRAVSAQALEPIMLNAALGRAVLLLSPRAEEKGVELSLRPCREELVVAATEDGLERIFVNLVGNAIKYTPSGGRVVISAARDGQQVTVAVADTGLGIPAEAMAHLFEEFYRAPNARAANITGTGLGLVIVKELVQRFQGQIDVASEVGQGTTFTVVLPRYR